MTPKKLVASIFNIWDMVSLFPTPIKIGKKMKMKIFNFSYKTPAGWKLLSQKRQSFLIMKM